VSHRKRIVALTVSAIALVAGCSATSPKTAPVVVASGTEGAQAWQIRAWKNDDGRLCLDLRPSAGDRDGTGGCQFDDSPTGGRTLSWDAENGAELVFGPVSPATARVRLVGPAAEPVDTTALPGTAAKGRLFVQRLPRATTVQDYLPLDANGRPVAKADF
jgi:hypothetical protein